mgnify:CR=1 FL=1
MQSLLYGFLFQLFQVELFFLFAVAGNGGTEHEVVVLQFLLVGKDDRPFDDVLQFADIARPVILFQQLACFP